MARAPAMAAENRRSQLLAAASRSFAAKGYHRTGVADIVAEAGVARGTFYRHFQSKREAFTAVLQAMMLDVVRVVQPIDVNAPIAEQVWANLDRLVRAIMVEDVARVLFAEAVGIDAEGDEALREFYGVALSRIEAALQTGQSLGVVHDGDVKLKARALLGVIKEPVFQAKLYAETVDADALVGELILLLRLGVLKND
jgi:AcrR family transcriptional regulator